MRSSKASGAASCAAARNSTPLRSRPNGTADANANAGISARNCSRASSACSAGSQATASNRHGSSAFRIFTAACFSSGCFESGQNAGEVSALTPLSRSPVLLLPDRYSSPQCIAMKACAAPTCALARTGTTMEPRREVTCTRSPSTSFWRAMSCTCMSSDGSGTWPNRRPTLPVRLMPCHWSRRRPVLSENG